MLNFLGPIVSAGATLLGGKLSADANNKAARLNAIAQANMADREREFNHAVYLDARDRDERLQREFAQSGIQWRSADAKAAGIHPLAAMGAQTMSFSSNVGAPQWNAPKIAPYAGSNMGSALASAGQDIGRAIGATRTEVQRIEAVNKSVQDLSLQRMGLENELLASQIRKINQPATPPAFPSSVPRLIPGQGNSPLVKDEPLKRVSSVPDNPSQEPAPITDIGYAASPGGGFSVVPSKDVKERIEDTSVYEWQHFMRNGLLPFLSKKYFNPPPVDPGYRREWYINPLTGEYRTRKQKSSHRANDYWFFKGGSSSTP